MRASYSTSRLAAWHIEGSEDEWDTTWKPPIINAVNILGEGAVATAVAGAVDPASGFRIGRFRARLPRQFLRQQPPYASVVALLVNRVEGEDLPPASDAIPMPTMAEIRQRLAGIYHGTTLPALAEASHAGGVDLYDMLVRVGHLVIPFGERPPAIREHFVADPSDRLSFFPQARDHIPLSLQP